MLIKRAVFFVLLNTFSCLFLHAQKRIPHLQSERKTGHSYTYPAKTLPGKKKDNEDKSAANAIQDEDEGIPEFVLDDGNNEDEEISISAVLNGRGDLFFNTARFVFASTRFRFRGYNYNTERAHINGLMLMQLDRKSSSFQQFMGITDILYSQERQIGLGENTFAFGGIGVQSNLLLEAHQFRKSTRASYTFSNRNYNHRVSYAQHTGWNKNNWATSYILTGRWGDEGYFRGTFQKSIGMFFSVSKQFSLRQSLSLSGYGGYLSQGRQSAVLAETRQLSGAKDYNPYWGMDAGRVRNDHINNMYQPYLILTHTLQLNDKSSLKSNFSYTMGEYALSGFDWFEGTNPSPEYYQKLPSYYYGRGHTLLGDELRDFLIKNKTLLQLNWAQLREANSSDHTTIFNAGGIAGNDISGKRAHYILSDRVTRNQQWAASTTYNTSLGKGILLYTGLQLALQKNRYFSRVKDLLGADFWVDVNTFFVNNSFFNDTRTTGNEEDDAEQNFQNDTRRPNAIVKNGDLYKYHYTMLLTRAQAWAQLLMSFRKWHFQAGTSITHDAYGRNGLMRNGLFPEHSLGKSAVHSFFNPQFKMGATYTINGKNYAYAHIAYLRESPLIDEVYIAPYLSYKTQEKIQSEKIYTTEVGFIHNSEILHLKLSGYASFFQDGIRIFRFYNDEYRVFSQYALSNIHKLHYGAELGADISLPYHLSLQIASSWGDYTYRNNPRAALTVDNSTEILDRTTAFMKGFRVEGTPQSLHHIGLGYRHPQFWYVRIQGILIYDNYVGINPLRRTRAAILNVNPETEKELLYNIWEQRVLPAQWLVNMQAGWSKRFYSKQHRAYFLSFNANIVNLLNKTDFIMGAYEQLRYDVRSKDPERFPIKYFYGMGLNYGVSVAFRF